MDKWKGKASRYLTEALFLERSYMDTKSAIYTLSVWDKTSDGKHYQSLHKLYVEMEDLSEYEFANKYFANYTHWSTLRAAEWFKPYYDKMREELIVRLQAKAYKSMLEQVKDGSASQTTLKYLADREFLPKGDVGRPSSKKKRNEAARELLDEDLERLGLH
jgi:hypothetical protein